MAAQVSEILDQQALPSGVRFPVQTAAVVARLVTAQALKVIDTSALSRLAVVFSVGLHTFEQRQGPGQRPWVDQGALFQVQPAPGAEHAQWEHAFDA